MNSNDALCLPDSSALPDLTVEDLISFDDCSFLAGDSLLHTEVPYKPFGFAGTATPFRLRSEGWSGFFVFLCLLLAACLVLRLRKKFDELVRSIFFPTPGKTDMPLVDDPLRYSTHLLAVLIISFTAAMVTFTYTQYDVGYYPFSYTPYILFFVFFVFWLGYLLWKRLACDFVNWIFFSHEKIFTWKRAYTFLTVAESILFIVLAMIVVYLPLSLNAIVIMALVPVSFIKIILLFKTYQIFFPKIYGTLHLFVYFCTLELMPLLVLLKILTHEGWLSTVII